MPRYRTGPLAPQQQKILQMYAHGHTETTIATTLYITVETVRTHRARIRKDLQAHTIAQAVAKAYDLGLLP